MELLDECKDRMSKSITSLKDSFATLRAGRVSPQLLDRVTVVCYGEPMPLRNVATVTVLSPTDLQVRPFDPSTLKDILGGLNKADLGCNPTTNSGAIILKFPAPSEDRRQDLVKQAKKYAEDGKVAIRNIRKDINNKAKNDDTLSEDGLRDLLDKIQKETDNNCKKIDDMLADKIKDIETI